MWTARFSLMSVLPRPRHDTRLTARNATDIVQYFRPEKNNQQWLWSNINKLRWYELHSRTVRVLFCSGCIQAAQNTRWINDGIKVDSRSCVSFLTKLGSFLLCSWYVRKMTDGRLRRWTYELNRNITRLDKISSRWSHERQDRHTNAKRQWTFATCFGTFLACQRFFLHSRSWGRCVGNWRGGPTMPKDSFTNGPMFVRSRPIVESGSVVWPSPVIFGTVWQPHYRC